MSSKPKLFSRFEGRHTRRFRDNPLELAFALAWQKANSGKTLDLLLDPSSSNLLSKPPMATDDQYLVAATVIQWLGSPVGQNFLVDVLKGKDGKFFRDRLAFEMEGKP